MATTEERFQLRCSLQDRGFMRTHVTMDGGNGAYEEVFTNGLNVITIVWGPKTEAGEFSSATPSKADA